MDLSTHVIQNMTRRGFESLARLTALRELTLVNSSTVSSAGAQRPNPNLNPNSNPYPYILHADDTYCTAAPYLIAIATRIFESTSFMHHLYYKASNPS